MKITLIPSAVSPSGRGQLHLLTSYLINDRVALDAGSLGLFGTPGDQARVRHLLISHSHIDHIASLPIFVENAYRGTADCVTVHGSEAVLECLRRDVFNDRVWPDFIRLSVGNPRPFLKLATLKPNQAVELEGLRVTPVAVNHAVPTFGFVVEDAEGAVVFPSDTGPTEEIWKRANELPNLQAVFLEAAFPDSMAWLAEAAKHLTPALLAREVRKLNRQVPIVVVHIKPQFHDQIVRELQALGLPKLEIGRPGRPYRF